MESSAWMIRVWTIGLREGKPWHSVGSYLFRASFTVGSGLVVVSHTMHTHLPTCTNACPLTLATHTCVLLGHVSGDHMLAIMHNEGAHN